MNGMGCHVGKLPTSIHVISELNLENLCGDVSPPLLVGGGYTPHFFQIKYELSEFRLPQINIRP